MKTILITGSSRGIGRALAEEAARNDYRVILHAPAESAELEDVLRAVPGSSKIVFDLLDTKAIQWAASIIAEQYGKIDILVNNAGIRVWKALLEQTDEEIEQGLRINLEAPIKLTKHLLPYITEGVINIASGASHDDYHGPVDFKNETVYAASKFGLRGFSFVLAKERPELKVLCVNPGPMATAMTDNVGSNPSDLATSVFAEYPKIKGDGEWQELNLFW